MESVKCPGFSESLKAGKVTKVTCKPTLADGLSVATIGYNSFFTAKPLIDKMVRINSFMVKLLYKDFLNRLPHKNILCSGSC